ncbi:hypothetical protein ASD11_11185 [Aeromicrobium sp. Root495]|uniref:DedA family protein n=1 Tax=Aeromicrobium sp. Root495 TaxID=1736550 RepID=UPI0006F31C62|nr:VTT domain-containing protein [Aeromicrobium sp. Root495]KQY60054.1 hypothetical protein ASD11_11185 [Aeromicrobium sp. Root495]
MIEEIRSWPWAWAWLTLFVIVLLRAGATWGIGRAIAAGALRRRDAEGRASAPRVRRAMERVEQWGPPVVTLSFLTVGAQTVVNLAAGLARMGWVRYAMGLVPGAAIWATIWTSLGAGVVAAATSAGADHTEAVVLLVLTVAVVLVVAVVASRRRRDTLEP